MFCREQVAQLQEWHPRFVAAGAEIVLVGNGAPEEARAFATERALPFRLLTDPSLRTYDEAGMQRTLVGGIGPAALRRAPEVYAKGFRQGATAGNLLQNGGAFLIVPDDHIAWAFLSRRAGDHFDPALPLAALVGRGAAPDPG